MIETKSTTVIGTPVCFIYEDNPRKKEGAVTVFVPNTKMNVIRKVSGDDRRIRSVAAGEAVAKVVGNFIENAPVLGNQTAICESTDGMFSYPKELEKNTVLSDKPLKPEPPPVLQ